MPFIRWFNCYDKDVDYYKDKDNDYHEDDEALNIKFDDDYLYQSI